MKKFLFFVLSIVMIGTFSFSGNYAQAAEVPKQPTLDTYLTPEIEKEINNNMLPATKENPVSSYTASNGLKVVDTVKTEPAYADSFSSKAYVTHNKTFYASGFSIATFKGKWLCTFWRDGSVTINNWDYFLVGINDGSYSNKSTSIVSSGKPAKARGYVTLQSRYFTGDTIWNVSISNGSQVSSSITKTR
ncbi:hypothetical protein PDR89_15335 [Bacillus cereus group sp. Bc002]|uniref:hypothetical protein n=1 Tax=Bacillus cereus group sp. Bc002 TaxID=3018130 RepID=UPI0022E7DE97|nr:hypothetical protein [Bacillus cereus group sp. Bc002]MDA2780812.1 hypothetical protein [Bacillus cereus group sp. Bc002]